MKNLVSVYGSLREGMGNHRLLESENSKLLGEFRTKPEYTLFSLGAFPGLLKNGNTSIVVEVYEVTDNVLKRLDGLEGYHEDDLEQSFYIRETINTPFGESYIYFYNGNPGNKEIVESGDWTEYRKNINYIARY